MFHPALILAAALVQQAPSAPFESKEGGFKIAMPSAPAERTQQIPSAIGQIDAHFYQATKNDVAYIVSYSDYPDPVAQADPAQVLEGAANGAVGGVKGAKLVKKQDRKIGQVPGKEVEFSFPGPDGSEGLGRARLYLSGKRMYSILVVGPKAGVSASSDAFFRSFGLTQAVAGAASKPAGPAATARPAMPKGRPTTPGAAARPGLAGPAGRARPGMTGPSAKAAAPAAAKGGEGLVPFSSEAGGFTVDLPGKPKEQTIKQPSPIGEIEVHLFVAAQEGRSYVVTYTKMPAEALKAGAGPILDGALQDGKVQGGVIQGTVTSVGGQLVSQKNIKLGAAVGREFEFTSKDPALYGRSQAYLFNGMVYQLLAMGPKDKVTGVAGDPFFKSFTLTAP